MVDQKVRVLLVEDNESDVKQISRLLRHAPARPFKLTSVKRLHEALQKLHRLKFDIILLDLGLPDSRGIATLEKVHSACPQVPIIVHTITGDESGIEAINRGAQDYLVKGSSDERILAKAIRYAIERKRFETEEQHNHELLKENEERLRLLVKASSDVLYQMSPDWSEVRQLSGGHLLADISEPDRTWLDAYIPSEEQKQVLAAVNRAIETRSVFELEHRMIRADGTVGWTFSRAVPRLNAEGEIIEWFGAASDITERKKAEEALRESEERFSAAFRNSPDASIISEAKNGRIVEVNKSWVNLLGFKTEESIGKRMTDIGIFAQAEDGERVLQILRKEGSVSDFPVDVRTKSGNPRKTLLSTVKLSKGLMLTIMRDVTERKYLEEQLEIRLKELASANKDLESFSYSVAHDLRNPLRAIRGFSDFLLEDCAGQLSQECREYIDSIRSGTGRMYSIIDDMLALSKISRLEMELTDLDLSEMARLTIKELQSAQPDRSVEVKIQDGLQAKGDARLISVVLGNLLGNAWKYTAKVDHPVIEFGAVKKDRKTIYYVNDNGAGFEMNKADKLFVPFQRLHSEQEFKGTGVGLAIVNKAVKRHGGNVWAEGEVGKGAAFFFTLNKSE